MMQKWLRACVQPTFKQLYVNMHYFPCTSLVLSSAPLLKLGTLLYEQSRIRLMEQVRCMHASGIKHARRREKVSYSSLSKHLKPDVLTGRERRLKLIKISKQRDKAPIPTPIRKQTRGFVPARFKLDQIPSDTSSKSRAKKQPRVKSTPTTTTADKAITKFDMAELEELKTLQHDKAIYDFEQMGLSSTVIDALKHHLGHLEAIKPTVIQALAIPALLNNSHNNNNQHVLCAAETGSGKTLAYLLPIIHRIKQEEEAHQPPVIANNDDVTDDRLGLEPTQHEFLEAHELALLSTTPIRKLSRPRVIILVPSCALVTQVHQVAKSLSHQAKFRAVGLTRNSSRKHLKRTLSMPIDMLITTPGSLLSQVRQNLFTLSEVRFVVVDEADTMFEKGFDKDVESILKQIKQCIQVRTTANSATAAHSEISPNYQFIMVSATLPKTILNTLEQQFPKLMKITTQALHKALPQCKQHFVDLKLYNGNKQRAFLDVLRQFQSRRSTTSNSSDRILVFCNTTQAVKLLYSFLTSKKIDALCMYNQHRSSSNKDKEQDVIATPEQLEAFLQLTSDQNSNESKDQSTQILICTDIASRGLDTTQVNHVILYDFPSSSIDYLHRIGRTCRTGSAIFDSNLGVVTSLIAKRDRILSERIKRCVRSNSILS